MPVPDALCVRIRRMRANCLIFLLTVALSASASSTEYQVGKEGDDANPGTPKAPLRTIQRAAELAQPGDTVTVHAGIYRERVSPQRGGTSERKRIVFRAAPGEKVEIKGSEVVKGWEKVQDGIWKATLANSFFGGFNPYGDLIHGDWFMPKGREHHTGAVYLNGEWLIEAEKLEDVLKPMGKTALWFGQLDKESTTIWAQFGSADPNQELVEINVRRTVFYPEKTGINFITVRGFVMGQAATPWAPPTAEQMGVIGTHWSKGWIIESNVVSHSVCAGIALGKYGDAFDNTSANTAEGYVLTIQRALTNGWNRENIGHHIVRGNTISHCEQVGIVGSLGAAFCIVTDNTIHDIHVRQLFTGAEMAGIKFHAAIDTRIERNHIYRTCLGLWLDWMAQGTRVSRNCFHDNYGQDLFVEVDHGPFVVDNNFFLSPVSLLDMSEGGAYAHNLFAGRIISRPEPNRATPYHPAHSTAVAGLAKIGGGDDRFYNNIFLGPGASAPNRNEFGLALYAERPMPLQTGGNAYFNGARPYPKEINPLVSSEVGPKLTILNQGSGFSLEWEPGKILDRVPTVQVTSRLLGKAVIPGLGYESADGKSVSIDRDYLGKTRHRSEPTPGPLELGESGPFTIWLGPE